MDRNLDFNNYSPYDYNQDVDYKDPLLNPMLQYEQAYMYYKYLNKQLEYKIKCKEYERLTKNDTKRDI